jgi:hypothetical protein
MRAIQFIVRAIDESIAPQGFGDAHIAGRAKDFPFGTWLALAVTAFSQCLPQKLNQENKYLNSMTLR